MPTQRGKTQSINASSSKEVGKSSELHLHGQGDWQVAEGMERNLQFVFECEQAPKLIFNVILHGCGMF